MSARLAENTLKCAIAAVTLAYVVFRVLTLDWTNDETWIRPGYADLLTGKLLIEQMNFLNYLLNTICLDILPFDFVLSIRIPSILALLVYMWAAWGLTSRLDSAWFRILGFTAFLSNAFMLDFFGLGRGYSIGLAFGLSSVRFLVEYTDTPPQRHPALSAHFSIWMAFLATLSSLAYLHFYIAIAAVLASRSFALLPDLPRKGGFRRIKGAAALLFSSNLYLIANALILFAFYLPRVIMLIQGNEMYSGGTSGFVVDTIASLVECGLYEANMPPFAKVGFAYGFAVLSCGIAIYAFVRRKTGPCMKVCAYCSAILLICTCSILAMHAILDVRFLRGRTALMFIPLFICQIVFFAGTLRAALARTIAAILLCFYIVAFLKGVNVDHTYRWRLNCTMTLLLDDLNHIHQQENRNLLLGVSDGTKYAFRFYGKLRGWDWLQFYPIDMYHRMTGQYAIHPQTDFFYIHHAGSDGSSLAPLPPALASLPLETVNSNRYVRSHCTLHRVKPGASLEAYLQRPRDNGRAGTR